ncbi:ImmA/IrrE family metallo-endopeptidase [Curtobacterium sp. VKM Ac-2852]|uniref:ImmA/IrrE family metallo-endopeptidase n=1 Tax=Curtobacterium sp. VKM Ac-2852 TaxID=2739024 RepID=UPI0015645D16|nr:ImmA/IrrE family metallo-endopeptidase [Curtobacterium sp. VKM Ac-2852]NQX22679.1 ImmA/IrrE family metallo-endopeptidase [Curtobacterium sp. VKM Ac-2852]
MTRRQSAAQAARRVLESFRVSDPNAPDLPVDPVRIARSLGINVYSARLVPTLSGMVSRLDPQGGTDIYLNSEHAPVRQRFTTAHELGHYFAVEDQPGGDAKVFVHRRDSLSACGTNSEEIFANQFAAELLMPEADVQRLHGLGLGSIELARRFNVSLDAMNFRLKNLHLAA